MAKEKDIQLTADEQKAIERITSISNELAEHITQRLADEKLPLKSGMVIIALAVGNIIESTAAACDNDPSVEELRDTFCKAMQEFSSVKEHE